MDDIVDVRLIGGPMDGATLPVDRTEIDVPDDELPGLTIIPEDGSSAPDGLTRASYGARPGEDPTAWHWECWVP